MPEQSQRPCQFYHTMSKQGPHCPSLSTKNFYWLLPEAWDKPMLSYYIQAKNSSFSRLDSPPAYLRRSKKKPPPSLLASWLLTDASRQPLAWAEAQIYPSSMKSLYVYLGGLEQNQPFALEALSLLISAALLTSEADVIKVTSPSPNWLVLLEKLSFGEFRTIESPFKLFGLSGLLPQASCACKQLSFSQSEWWRQPVGKKCRQTLHYLELRQAKKEKAQSSQNSRRPRGGLWRILFGRKKK